MTSDRAIEWNALYRADRCGRCGGVGTVRIETGKRFVRLDGQGPECTAIYEPTFQDDACPVCLGDGVKLVRVTDCPTCGERIFPTRGGSPA